MRFHGDEDSPNCKRSTIMLKYFDDVICAFIEAERKKL